MAPRLLCVAAAAFLLTGCVAQDKYNALKLEKDQLVEQLNQAQTDAAAARASADAFKNQIDQLMTNGKDAALLAKTLGDENAQLNAQLAEMKAKYEQMADTAGKVIVLDPQLSKELEELARQNPDVMEFDSARGIVRFKSDVTFARGSAELSPQAKQVIDRFAQILNSPSARNYEFLVAGHTDNTPVNNPATRAAGHKDNWYLSAHRAITVGQTLMSQGVSSRRLGAAGYADQRPVASNATSQGQARNRRVEVAILPSTYRGTENVAEAAPIRRTTAQTPAARTVERLDKDTQLDSRPLFNK